MQWMEILPETVLQTAFDLAERAQKEREAGCVIYPPQNKIFRALELTPPDHVKVVILGQDPYHTTDTADGLAFSTTQNVTPSSLNNIFRELCNDIKCNRPKTNDLTSWAKQGVLLLNTCLTVYEHQANSHKNWGWQHFVKEILKTCAQLPQPIVFLLWGLNAQNLKDNLMQSLCIYEPQGVIIQPKISKYILQSSHPSPLSATRPCGNTPAFLGSHPFSRTNHFLNEAPINWQLN